MGGVQKTSIRQKHICLQNVDSAFSTVGLEFLKEFLSVVPGLLSDISQEFSRGVSPVVHPTISLGDFQRSWLNGNYYFLPELLLELFSEMYYFSVEVPSEIFSRDFTWSPSGICPGISYKESR